MQCCKPLTLTIKNNPYKIFTLSLLATLLGVLSSPALHAAAATSISVTYAGTYSPSLSYAQGNVVKYGKMHIHRPWSSFHECNSECQFRFLDYFCSTS